ncbi:MAG TPA: hypothetical protein VHI75_09810 [Casimicrobiaceae bacterium]|nr:hypothetical protein [Casimicrobiaceae bacterium]
MTARTNTSRKWIECAIVLTRRLCLAWAVALWALPAAAQSPPSSPSPPPTLESIRAAYPGASHVPKWQSGWDALNVKPEAAAPTDEAQKPKDLGKGVLAKGPVSGRGTPLQYRIEACFPTEMRNLFSEVDMVPTGPDGALRPLNYVEGGSISKNAREAIRGQNTWLLWGEGNEAFWGWLQENGYGLADFLILADSRNRENRFRNAGLINQPGMKTQRDSSKKILGLYLDQADGDNVLLKQPDTDVDANKKLVKRPEPPPKHPTELFKVGDEKLYRDTISKLANDGVDPTVYGYPSGIVGLRLMPNPDFFGDTPEAKVARGYWQSRVVEQGDDNFYTESAIHADPKLVRPFRMSMTCGFCHVGPHPLNPPADPEAPKWSNLSSTIGDQYWTPPKAFSNLKKSNSFLWQFVASQQPGTIDTSLVSTDHINNANTINAIFEVNARLARAMLNPPEQQSTFNLLIPSVEDGPISKANPRHTPRVLLDGSDSIGVRGALARVYLNIGAYSEQWRHLHNPVIGFKPQRPFELPTIAEKSVYWRTTMTYRIPQLEAFFTYKNKASGESVTQPMKLAYAPGGKAKIAAESAAAAAGRGVFLKNCAICHSSKQPADFALTFSGDWNKPGMTTAAATVALPMDFNEWESFKSSDAYRKYVERIVALAGTPSASGDAFLSDNYLSSDIRIPITLVGTNSGRAVATNGMKGQVWDNFSSDDYKALPAVGAVRFFNPYLKYSSDEERRTRKPDKWGNNDAYAPPAGGPGYYRPASLVSLWATAPYLHNNALGRYTHDPSVEGRLTAYEDGIDKLLWKENRKTFSSNDRPGDMRFLHGELAQQDQGFIYRTTARSWIDIPGVFVRPLLVGILGETLTSILTLYLWLLLAAIAVLLVFIGQSRHAGFTLALFAVLVAVVLRVTGVDAIYPSSWWVPGIAAVAALVFWVRPQIRTVARIFFALVAAAFLIVAGVATAFVDGKLGPLKVGPIPMGTPVNLVMNINPEAPVGVLIDAVSGMTRGMLRIRKDGLRDTDGSALFAFEQEAGLALLKASKCPDFVLDRGHWFAEALSDEEKRQLKAFLKTL